MWSRADTHVAFEAKAGPSWKRGDERGLLSLLDAGKVTRAYGIYTGTRAQRLGPVEVVPVRLFLRRLRDGELLRS